LHVIAMVVSFQQEGPSALSANKSGAGGVNNSNTSNKSKSGSITSILNNAVTENENGQLSGKNAAQKRRQDAVHRLFEGVVARAVGVFGSNDVVSVNEPNINMKGWLQQHQQANSRATGAGAGAGRNDGGTSDAATGLDMEEDAEEFHLA
jgi:hypothetical protein